MCAMAGVLMQALDTTIANVALPNMMGDMSASRDQITWVLTSYIVAAAVMTAPVGWVAARFGKKNILLISMIGFTVASMLCGAAENLDQMVVFRLLQGVFGAALAPLSQSVMLDLYPVEKRGQAMAIFGIGIMLGPILGPTLGGYLTDSYSWRWVFYVNAPVGIAATVGLWLCFKDSIRNTALRFDFFGFGLMAMGVGALQLMLDRGTDKDWFSSTEIVVECTVAALGFYLFVVHLLTTKSTFIQRDIFGDRNFVSSQFLMFVVGAVLLASTALMPPYLQSLSGHTVTETGMLLGPRGLGTIGAMLIVGRAANFVDPRAMMTVGTACMSWSLWEMAHWTPSIGDAELLFVTIVQGFGLGLVFSPLQLVAFATLPGRLRTDGTAMMNLVRNIGSAIGISVTTTLLSDSVQAIHAQLIQFATPFNRALGLNSSAMYYNLALPATRAMFNGALQIRATIEAYSNDFLFMFYVTLLAYPLIWMMHRPAFSTSGSIRPAVAEVAE
ncbi:MAG: DHA2 family efflux MFS transporter permease subunit [Alphaproteobacteria bacterium]|nr:DHA2 family efflux MFS transporter permease subunit [Alphaproteobacteria bacterium]